MGIRKVVALIAVATALMGSLSASANNKSKAVMPEAMGNYNFRCTGPALDLSLVSFSLPISHAASTTTGMATGRAPVSSLTIEFAANSAYSTLYSEIIKGDHYSSCTLVETVETPVGKQGKETGAVFTWTFNEVTPTNVTAIWRDSSTAGPQGSDLPRALVRVTLNFNEVKLESSGAGKTATDSWTQTSQ